MMLRRFALPAVLTAALGIAACSTPESGPTSSPESTSDPVAEEPHSESEDERKQKSEPEPEPEPAGPELHQIGDLIERPTADVVVEVLEERDVIVTDFEADYEPGDDERLWYVDISWTTNLRE